MIFTIHAKAGEPRSNELIAVPESLAPWALVAPPIWLMVYRLWWWLAFYLLFVLLTSSVSTTSYAMVAMVLSWLPGVFLLLEGRELYRRKLEESGMQIVDVVSADDEDEAIGRYLMRAELDIESSRFRTGSVAESAIAPRPASREIAASSPGPFGLFSNEET